MVEEVPMAEDGEGFGVADVVADIEHAKKVPPYNTAAACGLAFVRAIKDAKPRAAEIEELSPCCHVESPG